MENSMYEMVYDYNNASYNVTDSVQVHNLLRNDMNFFKEYMTKNTSAPELIAISEDNTDKERSNFTWNMQSTKLFLQGYSDRKEKFRDSKLKKKQLWNEIVQLMKEYGYSDIDEDILDRKMRNMKRSYKTIKDNNKKCTTGRGRVTWEYYETFEDIFANDRTINHGPTLQSTLPSSTCTTSNQEPSKFPCAAQMIENEIDPDDPPILDTNVTASLSSTSCATPLSDSEHLQSIASNDSVRSESPLSRPSSTISGNNVASSSTTNNNKSLYNIRKKQLDVEEKRVEAINKMTKSLDESNKIQRERNNLLKQLLLPQLRPEEG